MKFRLHARKQTEGGRGGGTSAALHSCTLPSYRPVEPCTNVKVHTSNSILELTSDTWGTHTHTPHVVLPASLINLTHSLSITQALTHIYQADLVYAASTHTHTHKLSYHKPAQMITINKKCNHSPFSHKCGELLPQARNIYPNSSKTDHIHHNQILHNM